MQPRRTSLRAAAYPPSTILGQEKLFALEMSGMRAQNAHEDHVAGVRFVVGQHDEDDISQHGEFHRWFNSLISRSPHAPLILEVERFCTRGASRAAMERLGDFVDETLRAGTRDDEVNELLDALDPSRLAPNVIVALLTITWYAKERLTRREAFLKRAEKAMRATLGEKRAAALLANRR